MRKKTTVADPLSPKETLYDYAYWLMASQRLTGEEYEKLLLLINNVTK